MKESKTFDEATEELAQAWNELLIELGEMFGLDKLITWIIKFLD
ncbi:hypothetical protein [Enterococcus sp. DIV0240a]